MHQELKLDQCIAERRARLRERIERACERAGRAPDSVAILAVTKNHGPEVVEAAVRAGLTRLGENRVQEAAAKRAAVATENCIWECIGPVQSNKSRLAVALFDRIQSVDRIRIVGRLNDHARTLEKRISVLLQVNAGRDPNKHGVDVSEAPRLLEVALNAEHLHVDGLMTIAPLTDDPAAARRAFAALRDLRDSLESSFRIDLPELSMGMTDDLEDAVAEGSTCVRIGTALFGSRTAR